VCDKCGEKIDIRSDDTEEVVRNRLHVYTEQTSPLVEYFDKKHRLHRLCATKGEEEIYKDICKYLNV